MLLSRLLQLDGAAVTAAAAAVAAMNFSFFAR
jgi:hypothetical protein